MKRSQICLGGEESEPYFEAVQTKNLADFSAGPTGSGESAGFIGI